MRPSSLELGPAAGRELAKATKPGGYLTLTRGGKPVAYVLPAAIYDEEDIGYMTDPAFWKMIQERRAEPGEGIPLDVIKAKIAEDLRAEREAGKAAPRPAANGRRTKKRT